MKRLCCLLLAAALTLSLWGCAAEGGGEADSVLWFTSDLSDWETSTHEALSAVDYGGAVTVPALLEALLAGPPADSGLISPIPEGTRLLGWRNQDGVAVVDLSQTYGELVGVDLTLANYCIVLTLTQVEGIEAVRITLDGAPLPNGAGEALRTGDVVFSGVEEEPAELSAALYFRRTGTGELGYELRIFQLTEDDSPVRTVLEALLAGPQDTGLEPLLPQGLEIRSVRLEGGTCYVDVSQLLTEQVPQTPEEQKLVLDSLVSTLCGLDGVERVQLQVEGQDLTQYGALELPGPLQPAGGNGSEESQSSLWPAGQGAEHQ